MRLSMQKILSVFGLVLFWILFQNGIAQTTETISSGSGNWTVPCGVTSITVECWGAGGGGGAGTDTGLPGGSGGGGGAYAKTSGIVVVPGALIPYSVGAGGALGDKAPGGNGGNTTWNTTVVVAAGGTGGAVDGGAVGTGGTTVASTGTVKYAGGSGAAGFATRGGGGGGSAGDAAAGNTAVGTAGGIAVTNGGAGGNGGSGTGVAGSNGGTPGAGGGGAGRRSGGGTKGGAGANGQIKITYTVVPGSSTATTTGAWSTAATWGGSVPGTCNDITIPNGVTVTVTSATACNNLTIETGGTLITTSALTCNGLFTIQDGGTYTHSNTGVASTTIFAGSTSFGTASNIIVTDWHDYNDPLGQYATQFGNWTFSPAANYVWDQDGTFGGASQKLFGKLTVTAGQIAFDDGTGGTTQLIIDDVETSGSGTVFFQEGADRNYTLTTGNITHNGSQVMTIMDEAIGDLNWTLNGSFTTSQDFTAQESYTDGVTAGSTTVNVTGDWTINGGLFDFNRAVAGNVNLTFGGGVNITAADWVRFLDPACTSGNLSVTAGSMTISGGDDNDFAMPDATTSGNATFNITGDLTISGGTTTFYGGDRLVNLPPLVNLPADSRGDLTLTVGGTVIQTGGTFYGVDYSDTPDEGGNMIANFGAIDYDGGNFVLYSAANQYSEVFDMNVTGDANFNATAAGDQVILVNTITSGSGNPNTEGLDLDIGGDLIISGNSSAIWITSAAAGNEAIDVVGNFTISGMNVYFNGTEGAGRASNVATNVGGNMTVTGGTTRLSSQNGTVAVNVTGNTSISAGEVSVKVLDGTGTFTSNGNFSQSGGTWYHHKSTTNSTADVVALTVNGTFSHTGGTMNFDPNTTSTATHTATLNGSAITLGGTGRITHGNPGAGSVFGEIYVNPTTGTTTFDRLATTHEIRGTRVILNAGKTMDATGSTVDMQITANDLADDAVPATTIFLDIFGTLNLGDTKIYGRSNNATQRPTSLIVESGGEVQLSLAAGMYDGSNTASFMNRTYNSSDVINTVNSFNWWLDANSTITYNGTANQVVTGKYPQDFVSNTKLDATLGSTAGYHYAFLDINHQGTIGTNYVYPTASNVFVRSIMDLIRGEFRLDGSGTGYTINMENGATNAITVTGAAGDAYIRSETNLGTNPSIVRWYIGTTTGAHVIPFGHSAGSNNYIPFTFSVNSGTAGGYLDISTRATDDGAVTDNRNNLPWESTVTNMYDPTLSQDGALEAVIDRWWQIDVSAAYNADITFSYRGAENTLDAPYNSGNIGAQRWDGTEWQPDNANWGSAAAVLAGVGTCTVTGVSTFSPWILSSLSAPLPVKLISFNAECKDDETVLSWATASEQNNMEFIIYASTDGNEFTKVGTVDAYGNSTKEIDYQFVDSNRGDVFYRLVQMDLNGDVEVLSTINASCEITGDIIVYPNPLDEGDLSIAFTTKFGSDVKLELFDVRGRLVSVRNLGSIDAGRVITLDRDILQSGVYILDITSDTNHSRKRIVVK